MENTGTSSSSALISTPSIGTYLSPQGSLLIHRDLSWLHFNDRVLAEARDMRNPLLERAKFLGISKSNLDEFFMIRFASLNRSISTAARNGHEDQVLHLQSIRTTLMNEVKLLIARQNQVLDDLTRDLKPHGIHILSGGNPDTENPGAFELGKKIFDETIFPQLQAPEPFQIRKVRSLGNLQTAVIFQGASGASWMPIPKSLPSACWARHPGTDEISIFFLDQLLQSHLASALNLPQSPALIRLTRDGDLTVDIEEEDPETIPDVIRTGLGIRDRGRSVRLQFAGRIEEKTLHQIAMLLKLDPTRMVAAVRTLFLHGLVSVVNQLPEHLKTNPTLFYPPIRAVVPPPLRDMKRIFSKLKERDLVLHHPYDSFDAFVNFIREASEDPSVTSIEMTAYRTDAVSQIIQCIKKCAKKKRVRVMIELRARFDELNNLRLAEELREAGAEVAFGFGKLKLHAKIALVTRMEEGRPVHYSHLSTGNYNAVTARQYTDLSILTANQEIGSDARAFFDAIVQGQVPTQFKQLVSAPARLHRRILSHIDAEIKAAKEGKKARIVAKVNALVDETIIESLYRASQAGVQVDLIVRGACSLLPGVKGLSENIRVVSIVDRFLEHSRIYFFESSRQMYISSADWMPRNFFSRLELAYPVLDPRIYSFIEDIVIPAYLADTRKARELNSKGEWLPRTSPVEPQIRSQFFFEDLAAREYAGTSLVPQPKSEKS